ncbi:MAG: FAD-dependent oxidoreductase, partial [Candidatus Binataceae bacterium]
PKPPPEWNGQLHTFANGVPLSVLESEQLTFSPALPSQHQEAISGLPMDVVEKIALQFNKDIFNVGTINILATTLVDKVGNSFMHAQLWGKNVGICIVGGDLARDLDAAGCTALIDYALATMVSMFGSAVSAAFVKGNNSSWLSDPYSIGAYTYACPERFHCARRWRRRRQPDCLCRPGTIAS